MIHMQNYKIKFHIKEIIKLNFSWLNMYEILSQTIYSHIWSHYLHFKQWVKLQDTSHEEGH